MKTFKQFLSEDIIGKDGRKYQVGHSNGTWGIYHGDERIGVARLDDNKEYVRDIRIHKDHQKNGIATQLYDQIEDRLGKKLKPDPLQSDAGKALWASRTRGKE